MKRPSAWRCLNALIADLSPPPTGKSSRATPRSCWHSCATRPRNSRACASATAARCRRHAAGGLREHPARCHRAAEEGAAGVAISVAVGTYDILVPSLLVGDLDMVLGRLPEQGRSRAACVRGVLRRAGLPGDAAGAPAHEQAATRPARLDARAWLCRCPRPSTSPDRARLPRGRAAVRKRHRVGFDPDQPRALEEVRLHRRHALSRGAR